MEKMDGKTVKSVVIFVKSEYVLCFGYHTTGEDRGQADAVAGNPYNYDSLASLIMPLTVPI